MTKRKEGHVFVKTASGLVIPFKPPALDYVSAAGRESEREPDAELFLKTIPGQAYEGYIVHGDDGEPELWFKPVDNIGGTYLPLPPYDAGPLIRGLPEV